MRKALLDWRFASRTYAPFIQLRSRRSVAYPPSGLQTYESPCEQVQGMDDVVLNEPRF